MLRPPTEIMSEAEARDILSRAGLRMRAERLRQPEAIELRDAAYAVMRLHQTIRECDREAA